jgi:hypothetical protein
MRKPHSLTAPCLSLPPPTLLQLIGGGFAFNNPSAAATCGCGKSFGV